MIRRFPEIEQFFDQYSFTDIELEEFQKQLRRKYQDRMVYEKALELISLKMLYFEAKAQEIGNTHVPNSKKATKTQNIPQHTKFDTIQDLADYLKVKPEFITRLYIQKSVSLPEKGLMPKEGVEPIQDYVDNRIQRLSRIKKLNRIKNRSAIRIAKKRRKKSASTGTYAKIQAYGLGKLIYIRK